MARLTRIYTRTGDDGSTGIADGTRLAKDSPRIEAIGTVDELNAALGLLRNADCGDALDAVIADIQHRLFDLGGGLVHQSPVVHLALILVGLPVDQAVIDRFVAAAESLDYPTDELIFVDQSPLP